MAGVGTFVLFPGLGVGGYLTSIGVTSAIGGILACGIVGSTEFGEKVPRHSGAAPGNRIAVDLLPEERAELRAAKSAGSIEGFVGCLKRPGTKTLSVKEIGELAAQGWAGRH
jgi:hypothetical protein